MVALVVLAGGIRFAVAEAFPSRPVGDENYYLQVALNQAAGLGAMLSPESRAFKPPAHPFLMSWVMNETSMASGRGLALAKLRAVALQVLLGTLLVPVTALLGWALFNRRTGFLAGAITAVFPTMVAFSHYLWSENLFALLIVGGLTCVVRAERARGWALTGAAGVLFGLAALTREAALVVAAASAFWWGWTAAPRERARALAQGALLLGLALLVVLPWTARNYALFGRLIPVSTVGWYTLAGGNTFESPDWRNEAGPRRGAFKDQYFAISNEMERLDFARAHAFERIAAEQPTWIFKKLVRNGVLLWGPDSFLFYKLRRGAYGDLSQVSPWVLQAFLVAPQLAYLIVFVLGACGMVSATGRGRRLLPCLVIAGVSGLHILAIANSRHRMPLTPLLIVYASYAALRGRELRADLRGYRWLAPALALAFLFGLCVPYYYF